MRGVGIAQKVCKLRTHVIGKHRQTRHLSQQLALVGRHRHAQNARRAGVAGLNAAIAVQHDHASGEVVQNSLQIRPRRIDLAHAQLHRRTCVAELLSHVGK